MAWTQGGVTQREQRPREGSCPPPMPGPCPPETAPHNGLRAPAPPPRGHMPRELWVLAEGRGRVGGVGAHQTAKSSNSEAVSLGKGGPSDHGCGSWSLARVGPGLASNRESRMETQGGHRGRGRGLLEPGELFLSIHLKGTQSWGELLSARGLVQEVSGDAPPLPSSPLSGTFSFSSAPETTHKGWQSGTSCGRDMGSAQTLGQMLGRREATEDRQEAVKREQGLGAPVLDRGQSQPYQN